jgi:CNP1-like family
MRVSAAVFCALFLAVGQATAQLRDQDPDWRESAVPAPPDFDVARVIQLEMPRHLSVRLGVDPATLRITSDGVVRYVMVAQSPSGTMNATYEGIRCQTAEVKVYARYTSSKTWNLISNPEWKPLRDNQPSPHALALARQGACDGRSAVTSTPQAIVDKLKSVERASLHK